MKLSFFLSLIFLFVCNLAICRLPVSAQSLSTLNKVKQVKLLESNRDEIEKIFGQYKSEKIDSFDNAEFFTTSDSRVKIEYSKGICNLQYFTGWNIPEGIVIGITVYPDLLMKPADLEFDFSTLQMEKVFALPGQEAYTNNNTGIKFLINSGEIEEISFFPSKKDENLSCAKKLSVNPGNQRNSSKSFTFQTFGPSRKTIIKNFPAIILNVMLSSKEIKTDCSALNSEQNNNCSIKILTIAKDAESDMLEYRYTVSGGKIIGTGEKVLWDLSGVKAGVYTITVNSDDGCGFCGKPMNKTVVVKGNQ